jgi:hypothetical protein
MTTNMDTNMATNTNMDTNLTTNMDTNTNMYASMYANRNVTSIVTGQLYHVLLPRNSRIYMGVELPENLPAPDVMKLMETALQKTFETSISAILKVEYMEEKYNEETCKTSYIYGIIYLNIPKEVFEKLRMHGISRCKCYVGLDEENTKDLLVLNNRPFNTDLSTTNRDGIAYPYESSIIMLDK